MTLRTDDSSFKTLLSLPPPETEGMQSLRLLRTELAALVSSSSKRARDISEAYKLVPEVEATLISNILGSCQDLMDFDCCRYLKDVCGSHTPSVIRKWTDKRKVRKEKLEKIWQEMRKHKEMCSRYQKNDGSSKILELRKALFSEVAFPLLEMARRMKDAVDGEIERVARIASQHQEGERTLSPPLVPRSWRSTKFQGDNRSSDSSPQTPKSPTWSIPFFMSLGSSGTSMNSSILDSATVTHKKEVRPNDSRIAPIGPLPESAKDLSRSPATSVSTGVSSVPVITNVRHETRVDSFDPYAKSEVTSTQANPSQPVLIKSEPDTRHAASKDVVASVTPTQNQSRNSIGTLLMTSIPLSTPPESPLRERLRPDLPLGDASTNNETGDHPPSISSLTLADFEAFVTSRPSYQNYIPSAQQAVRYSSFWPEDGSRLVPDSGDGTAITPSLSDASGATTPSASPTSSVSPTSSRCTASVARHIFPPRYVPPKGSAIRTPESNSTRYPPRTSSLRPINSIPSISATHSTSQNC
jgi:hypothetical protein